MSTKDCTEKVVSTRRRLSLLGAALLWLLSGCGPTATIAPGSKSPGGLIALLPTRAPSDVSPERVNLLNQILYTALGNKGYFVLDQRAVSAVCSNVDCPERKNLIERYSVAELARLELDSFDRNNFIAGYYNDLSGRLVFTDTNNRELLSVQDTARESGGVVVESGQVLQGLISQIENTGDKSFARLAQRFVTALISKVPPPEKGTVPPQAQRVAISSVEAKPNMTPLYQVCANATPGSMASLVLNRERTTLREALPGEYCGIFRLDTLSASPITPYVEVQSAFGEPVRRDLQFTPIDECKVTVEVRAEGHGNRIIAHCETAGSDSKKKYPRVIFYRAPSNAGPFEKVAEVRNKLEWFDGRPPKEPVTYAVVLVDEHGLMSEPVEATLQ